MASRYISLSRPAFSLIKSTLTKPATRPNSSPFLLNASSTSVVVPPSSIRHAGGSSLLVSKPSRALISGYFPGSPQNDIEHVRRFSTHKSDPNPFSMWDRENINSRDENEAKLDALRDRLIRNSRSENDAGERVRKYLNLDALQERENVSLRDDNEVNLAASGNRSIRNSRSENYAENGRSFNRESDGRPLFMRDRERMNSRSENDAEPERSYRPMDFVRGVIDEEGEKFNQVYSSTRLEMDADFVHIKMLRNNTFVTVTDSKGNIKLSGSAGSVKEMKAGQKLSRYAAEATAEVVGRRARGLGLKAVVMKVNGFTHFRRKRQAVMSWLEGFSESRGDRNRNPVVHIEDTTRKPHNGCRPPKKRRI